MGVSRKGPRAISCCFRTRDKSDYVASLRSSCESSSIRVRCADTKNTSAQVANYAVYARSFRFVKKCQLPTKTAALSLENVQRLTVASDVHVHVHGALRGSAQVHSPNTNCELTIVVSPHFSAKKQLHK